MTKSMECPAASNASDMSVQGKYQIDAQSIIDGANIQDVLKPYVDEVESITTAYATLSESKQRQAASRAVLLARRGRGAYMAAYYHCIHGRLAEQLLEVCQRDDNLDAHITHASNFTIDLTDMLHNVQYQGQAGLFINALGSLYDDAMHSLSSDYVSETGKLFKRIDMHSTSVGSMMESAASIAPPGSIKKIWGNGSSVVGHYGWNGLLDALDDSYAVFSEMHAAVLEKSGDLTVKALGVFALHNLELLTTVASLSKGASHRILPDYFYNEQEGHPVIYAPNKQPETFYVNEHYILAARQRSLAMAALRSAHGCSALTPLQTHDASVAHATAARYNAYGLKPSGPGIYQSFNIFMPLAIEVATLTLFRVRSDGSVA